MAETRKGKQLARGGCVLGLACVELDAQWTEQAGLLSGAKH